jgi:hypothetical protein
VILPNENESIFMLFTAIYTMLHGRNQRNYHPAVDPDAARCRRPFPRRNLPVMGKMNG